MELVRIETDAAGIQRIRLDRPKVNAQNVALLEQLGAAFAQAEADAAVRGVLLCATGRCFSAGLDLREVVEISASGGLEDFLRGFEDTYRGVFFFDKPLACAVAGHGVAGGAVLPLMADHLALLDDPTVKFGLTELAVGVPFPQVAFEAVRLALSPRALRSLVYGGAVTGMPEAHGAGVGDVLTEDPEAAAYEWLATVSSRPLRTFRIAKRQIRAEARARSLEGARGTVRRKEIVDALTSVEVAEALAGALA